eukprot:3067000-Rhodomonas_salina.6
MQGLERLTGARRAGDCRGSVYFEGRVWVTRGLRGGETACGRWRRKRPRERCCTQCRFRAAITRHLAR